MKFECEICGVKTNRWKRCDEHYICDDCGTKGDLCFFGERQGGLLCGVCKAKRVETEIAKFKGDTSVQDCIVCPWCGYAHYDSLWEYQDNKGCTCHNCEHNFLLEIINDPKYSTRKMAA